MLRDTDMEAGAAEHIQWLQCTFGGLLSFKPCKTLETQSKTAIPPWLGFPECSSTLSMGFGFLIHALTPKCSLLRKVLAV